MQENTTSLTVVDNTANPAPLGLIAFGTTTVLLNIHNAGFYEMNSMILAMGVFYGGIAQVIAGIMEWKKNNTFGTTAFTSYGLFWLSLVGLVLMPKMFPTLAAPDSTAMSCYLAIWGLFTAGMFIATLKLNRALQFVFASLTILFFLLAYGDFMGDKGVLKWAGREGIICGFSAIYTGLALVINEHFGSVLPLGHLKR